MRRIALVIIFVGLLQSCKEQIKSEAPPVETVTESAEVLPQDSVNANIPQVEDTSVMEPSKRALKEELMADGFKILERIDPLTQDTIIMQQYFMVFLKNGPIRGQNEEEIANLQQQHEVYLKEMQTLGYADLSGSFEGQGDIQGVAIYNVPHLKMADSLARLDPMVKAGHFEIEVHPLWAKKGASLH